jgi:superfamily II DNA or RNA helicase
MDYRPYQIEYIDNIQINKSNLVISPMRSGKSVIIKGIIDKYFSDKKVLIITGIRHVITQLATYYTDYSFILSGHEYDHTKLINLATFQTFSRRTNSLTDYDAIFVDEVHMRFNTDIVKQIRKLNCTRVYFTGTPITNRNTFLSDEFDNVLEFTNIKQMLDEKYLAPTRFLMIGNMLKDESSIQIRNGDYVNEDIDQIIDKTALIEWIVNDNLTYEWSTKHKTIMYTNSIATTQKIVDKFNSPNVKAIHSKLTPKQIEETMSWFESTDAGIIVNCRMLTVGVDIPSADTVVYLLPTKIHSLFLQSIFRASTKSGDKIATVYDYSGMLNKVNPYDNQWKKPKLSCKDQCIKQYPNDPLAQYFCIEACKSNPILVPCKGELPISLAEHPFISNYQIHSGKPCGESRPMWEYEYKQTNPSTGILTKWTKCKCGCVTSYDVRTLAEPSAMIQVYSDVKPVNTVTVLLSVDHHKALALFDDLSSKSYLIGMYDSSDDIYQAATDYFKSKPFQIMSNVQLKLPNVQVNPGLEQVMPLIDWFSDNQGFIKKLIKAKLTSMVSDFAIKPGYTWHALNSVNESNQKAVLQFLKSNPDRTKFIKYFKKLQGN